MKFLVLLAVLALAACNQSPVPMAKTDIAGLGKIVDLHSGETLMPEQLLVRLAGQQRVIVGEKHDNPYHHQIELWLVEQLPKIRPQGSVLLEMITPNQQGKVDATKQWLQSHPTADGSRVAELTAWQPNWKWSLYGDIVMAAMQAPYPLLSANLDRSEITAFYKQPVLPPGQISVQPEIQQALAKTIRESHGGEIGTEQLHAMVAIQQQRDRRMAERLLAAPLPALLMVGGYHASRAVGVPLHMQDLQPGVEFSVLMLAEQGAVFDRGVADYLWITKPAKD